MQLMVSFATHAYESIGTRAHESITIKLIMHGMGISFRITNRYQMECIFIDILYKIIQTFCFN